MSGRQPAFPGTGPGGGLLLQLTKARGWLLSCEASESRIWDRNYWCSLLVSIQTLSQIFPVGNVNCECSKPFSLQGVIATKLIQQNACYISTMNKNKMPSFDNLARLARESRVRVQRSSRFLTLESIGPFLSCAFSCWSGPACHLWQDCLALNSSCCCPLGFPLTRLEEETSPARLPTSSLRSSEGPGQRPSKCFATTSGLTARLRSSAPAPSLPCAATSP